MFGCIYKITNVSNNKCYIGKTTAKDIIKYIKNHFKSAISKTDKKKRYFYNSIRKYGEGNFKYEILGHYSSKEELNAAEQFFISLFQSYDSCFGYNMTLGGDGGDIYSLLTEERKKERDIAISKKKKGKKRTPKEIENMIKSKECVKGKKYEEIYGIEKATQIKEKLRRPGKLNNNFGNTWTNEQKKNLSDYRKNLYQGKKENHPSYKNINLTDSLLLLLRRPKLTREELNKIVGITYYTLLKKYEELDYNLFLFIKYWRK